MRSLSCPKCRATLTDGTEFGINLKYSDVASGGIEQVEDDGTLVVEWWQRGHLLEPRATVELFCGACRHIWTSRRRWSSFSSGPTT